MLCNKSPSVTTRGSQMNCSNWKIYAKVLLQIVNYQQKGTIGWVGFGVK